MIDIDTLLTQDRVVIVESFPSRKTALRQLAQTMATGEQDLRYREIFFALQEREQEGSTALDGLPIAIPHCRLDKCKASMVALVKTRTGHAVDFGGDAVRLLIGMCFPQDEPALALSVLRLVVNVVEDQDRIQRLLDADTSDTLYKVFYDGLRAEVEA